MTLSGALLLRQIGEADAAQVIICYYCRYICIWFYLFFFCRQALENAIEKAVADRNTTSDLGGKRTTNECTQAIIDSLK